MYIYIYIYWLVVEPTPLNNDEVNVSWDDDIPNMMGKIIQMFQTTNQYNYIIWFIHPCNNRYITQTYQPWTLV